ncbi:MAG: sigma-70 family RNA polymerase sigma factor [Candidatus Poribacteria bacterium]|nr:sigma-70 family RNA polymerase sigma factor [Candidatus Poribacteria bacterium]
MAFDVGAYYVEIGQFVNRLCDKTFRAASPEDRLDMRNEVTGIAVANRRRLDASDPDDIRAWLWRTAENVVRNRIRAHVRHSQRTRHVDQNEIEAIPSTGRTADKAMLDRERINAVRDAIHQLPPDLRTAIELFYLEGCSVLHIAEHAKISDGTVKSRLFHARQRLRGLLETFISD